MLGSLLLASVEALTLGSSLKNPLIVSDDYPPSVLHGNIFDTGSVGFRVLYSPDGIPQWCAVTEPSGVAPLDSETCKILIRRPFNPAIGMDGNPAYYLYHNTLNWGFSASHPDMTVSLLRLPADLEKSPEVDVALQVNQSGAIIGCNPKPSKASQKLGMIACQQVRANWHPQVAKTTQGIAVVSVQNVEVAFEVTQP